MVVGDFELALTELSGQRGLSKEVVAQSSVRVLGTQRDSIWETRPCSKACHISGELAVSGLFESHSPSCPSDAAAAQLFAAVSTNQKSLVQEELCLGRGGRYPIQPLSCEA
jgi:hypothetical protein